MLALVDDTTAFKSYRNSFIPIMKTRILLLALLASAVCSPSQAADHSFTGRYTTPAKPDDFFELEADGTFILQDGSTRVNGSYTVKGSTVALTVPGSAEGHSVEIANGSFIGPDGKTWKKTGAPAASPAGHEKGQESVVGRYSSGLGNADHFFELKADGTFILSHNDKEKISGTYSAQQGKVTLNVPGEKPIVIEIANGSFIGPDQVKWQKSAAAATPGTADRKEFAAVVGKYHAKGGNPEDFLELMADGQFVFKAGEAFFGGFTVKGTSVTLNVKDEKPITLEIVNGVFTGPDKKQWVKASGSP